MEDAAVLRRSAIAAVLALASCSAWQPLELDGVITGIYPAPIGGELGAAPAQPGWIIVVRTGRGLQPLRADLQDASNFSEGDLVTICGVESRDGRHARWQVLKRRKPTPSTEAPTSVALRYATPGPPGAPPRLAPAPSALH